METKGKSISLKAILIFIAIGIWAIVLQNAGLIPTSQRVKIVNEVDANIVGRVNANVSGSVSIDNTVDINIQEINGKRNVFYKDRDGIYALLPTYSPYNY